MKDDFILGTIIGDIKNNSTGELIVVLFEQCNLSCQMCYQNHNSIDGIDTILEKFDIVAKALDTLKMRGKTEVSVNFMGGELFSDQLPDNIFDDYRKLINDVREYAVKIDLPIKISIPSNMVWSNQDRVLQFVKQSGIILNASYDPAGRFTPTTFEIFKNNVKFFKDHIKQIGVVMTKPSIKKFMNNQTPFFDYLYENFTVSFDHYTHSNKATLDPKIIMPLDHELRDFYKYMIDHWPNCYPFIETASKLSQPMFCMRTMYVFSDSSFGSCGSVESIILPLIPSVDTKETKKVIKITKETASPLEKMIESKFFDEYDCVSCEHMSRCSMSCFLNNHFYSTRTQEACWLKEVYDYVDSK